MIKVLYLPGIGDHRPWFQDKLIKLWQFFGLKAEFLTVGWADDEPFKIKLERIVEKVDELAKNGDKIALVGISAGAGAALNAYMQRKDRISSLVFICGKLYGTTNIHPRYFQANPAFKGSVYMSDDITKKLTPADKNKMLYIYTRFDQTVIPSVNRLAGLKEKKVLAFGHISGIYFTILFHGRLIAKFIKSRS